MCVPGHEGTLAHACKSLTPISEQWCVGGMCVSVHMNVHVHVAHLCGISARL